MFDLDDLFEDLGPELPTSQRARRALRLAFGLLGLALAASGAWHTWGYPAGLAFRLSGIALFVFLGAFCLVNVALGRPAAWPWKGLAVSFCMLFLARILFGA